MTQDTAKTTPAFALFDSALSRLISSLNLKEVLENKGPWLPLTSHAPFHQGSCGHARLFRGDGIEKLLSCSISAPAIGLDSHMLFAFTPSNNAIPHFTVDSVQAGEHMAFHLDLIPRVDLATHLGYMDWAFGGLNETFQSAGSIEGLSPAQITPRQRAVMSPWMLVNRASPEAFEQITPLVHSYLTHWLGLLSAGVPKEVIADQTEASLVTRDEINRSIIFDPDVDKVWNQITGLIGAEAVATIRGELMKTTA